MPLRVTPLGGLGEIGLNCLVVEAGDDALVVDAGSMFPSGERLGVDVVAPDFAYLSERPLRGILLTHAHEDHIGALARLLAVAPAPVYG